MTVQIRKVGVKNSRDIGTMDSRDKRQQGQETVGTRDNRQKGQGTVGIRESSQKG